MVAGCPRDECFHGYRADKTGKEIYREHLEKKWKKAIKSPACRELCVAALAAPSFAALAAMPVLDDEGEPRVRGVVHDARATEAGHELRLVDDEDEAASGARPRSPSRGGASMRDP
jgi:hypothetical protein